MYPKLAVEDVALKMNLEAISIKVEDKELPLYKSAEFTKAISSWLKLELFEREKRLKFQLQKAERRIMANFGY